MGIAQDAGDRLGATYSSRIARRIYHGTLLGLHSPAERLQRISRGTSALEDLECHQLRIERERCSPLRQTIRRNIKSAAVLRVHCRRLTDYRPKTPDAVGRLCQTPKQRLFVRQQLPQRGTSSLLVSPPPRLRLAGHRTAPVCQWFAIDCLRLANPPYLTG